MKGTLIQMACVTIPKGLGGVLTVVLNGVLLTRMTPAEFGVYAVCLTLVILAEAVLGNAIDMSAVKLASAYSLRDMPHAGAVERWAIVFKLGLSALTLSILLAFASPVSQALFHRHDPGLLVLTLSVAAGVLMMRSLSTHLQLQQRFSAYARIELLAQALRVCGIGVVLVSFAPSAEVLLWAALAGTILSLAGGLQITQFPWRHWHLEWSVGKEFLGTLRWMLATIVFSSLLARIDVLLLTRWSTIEQVGVFAAAQVFALIPEMLGLWLAVVFSRRVAPARADGTLLRMMTRVQLGLAAFALLVGFCAWLSLHSGAHWLPARYERSADVLMPLLIGALAGMLALPVTVPYILFTRPRFLLALDFLSLPLLVLAYHWAIGESGAIGAAWVSGGTRIMKSTLLLVLAWMWARQGSAEPATASLPAPAN